MVKVIIDPYFQRIFLKIKDNGIKGKIMKQIEKIKINPGIGKPMRFNRKGTRELYIPPFRLSYKFIPSIDTLYILDLYHKDEQ